MNFKEEKINLYSLSYSEYKTYLYATLFICGNIALPQLCHMLHLGGKIFLPIYFFTLIASYKYGMKVGLLTAILSPIINSAFFGMPPVDMLWPILSKSCLCVLFASAIAEKNKSISIGSLFLVVVLYQISGCLLEWMIKGSLLSALQDFRLGIPGLIFQILGGYAVLKYILRK